MTTISLVQQQISHVIEQIAALEVQVRQDRSCVGTDRDDLWKRISDVRLRCLDLLTKVISSEHVSSNAQVISDICDLDRKIAHLFFVNMVQNPISLRVDAEQRLFHTERNSDNLRSFKSRLCRKLFDVISAFERADTAEALHLHSLLPIEIRWNHYHNLSQILHLSDPTGVMGRKAFLGIDPLVCASDQHRLLAITTDYSEFSNELIYASSLGHVEIMRFFSSGKNLFSPWKDGAALMHAVHCGHVRSVEFILSAAESIDDEVLNGVYCVAAKEGFVELFHLFDQHDIIFDEHLIRDAISFTVQNAHLECYLYLINKLSELDVDAHVSMILSAINQGSISSFERLLETDLDLSDIHIQQLAKSCACFYQLAMLRKLFEIYPDQIPFLASDLFVYAVECNKIVIVEMLLDNYLSHVKHRWREALVRGLCAGHFHFCSFFLSKYKVLLDEPVAVSILKSSPSRAINMASFLDAMKIDVSADQKLQMFISGCYIGSKETLLSLYPAVHPLSRESIKTALMSAALGNSVEMVQWLCSLDCEGALIKCADIEEILDQSIALSSVNMFAFLFDRLGRIDQVKMEYYLYQAILSRRSDLVRVILDRQVVISAYAKNLMLIAVIDQGDLTIFALVSNWIRELADIEIVSLMSRASQKGHGSLARSLAEKIPHLPSEHLAIAITASAEQSDMASFDYFTSRIPSGSSLVFAPMVVDRLLLHGARSGHIQLVRFYLQNGSVSDDLKHLCIQQTQGPAAEEIRALLASSPSSPAPDIFNLPRDHDLMFSFEHLSSFPMDYLQSICSDSLPARFYVMTSIKTFDTGGVTREFFFTLIQALKKQKLITTTSCGSAIDEGNDLKCFELLGTLCSVLYNQNQSRSEPLLLGNVFHPSFFELVKHALILSNEDILIKQGAVILRNVEPDYRPAFDLVLDPHHRGKIEAFRSLKIIFGLEGDDLSCAKQIVCQFIRPVQRFSKGLSKALSQIFSFHSSEELAILIQGRSLLKEEIIKALCPLGESSSDFETKLLWVKDWLLRASQEQCRGFVHAITGSENISDSLKIHVGASEDGSEHFTLRTCLNTILIPTNAAIDFDSFCLALEAIISSYEFNDE